MKLLIKFYALIVISIFSSCSRDADPSGKFIWMIIGFPVLGIILALYNWLFGSKKDK